MAESSALVEEVGKIIAPLLEGAGAECIEINFTQMSGRRILRVLADRKEGGITLGECADLNRKISELLDAQGIIKNDYILEVSSPGLDRPLTKRSDFLRCLSRNVRVFLKEPVNGKLEWAGLIKSVGDETVDIDSSGQLVTIPLAEITKAKQIIENT